MGAIFIFILFWIAFICLLTASNMPASATTASNKPYKPITITCFRGGGRGRRGYR
jgi:hypothetical protein